MLRRRDFGTLGLGAAALAMLEGSVFAQEAKKAPADHSEHADHLRGCAKACSDCQRECGACATHCAHKLTEGHKQHLTTLATCQDCADICAAASQVAARGGPFAGLLCAACADACSKCAKACEQFPDDAHMKKCAEECRRCEKECREMVKHLG